MATSVNKILVPLDNSKNSFRGLSSAIYLAKMCDAKIIALHSVYASPKGDFDTSGHFSKDHKKQLSSMMEIAEKQCEKAGILAELRKREHYEKPSVKRKRKAIAAKKRAMKRARSQQWY